MKEPDEQIASRRQWFRAAARWGLLSLLAAISGVLIWRGRRADGQCAVLHPCNQCGLAAACHLPKVESFRQNREES